jgi:uncharacterized protein (TIGR02452 family)
VTSAAPNAGALNAHQTELREQIPKVLMLRASYVLSVAEHFGHDRIVLGAWGCGVFRNDPVLVARTFKALLAGTFANAFREVVFAVFDASKERKIFQAFASEFGE